MPIRTGPSTEPVVSVFFIILHLQTVADSFRPRGDGDGHTVEDFVFEDAEPFRDLAIGHVKVCVHERNRLVALVELREDVIQLFNRLGEIPWSITKIASSKP